MSTARCSFCLLSIVLGGLGGGSSAVAADVFLTLGGGYSAAGNQISLEKNVQFFQRVLAEIRQDAPRHDIYFSDGDDSGRDVQYADPDSIPQANRLMAELFGDVEDIDLQYRNHAVEGVRGETSTLNLDAWFEDVGSRLESGDRLFIYATAHGGKSKNAKDDVYNTRLLMWGKESITAREFSERITTLPDGVTVVVVMVQCYCGGFASIIFDHADQAGTLADRDVCGFFATTHTRPAAGCSPDIDEQNYQEYSSFFWEGLSAISRLGHPVTVPDYDEDGRVSFAESHAYVVLTSDTIDIPTKTSGIFLRKYSKLGDEDYPHLMPLLADRQAVLAAANPSDQAVIRGLSAALDLDERSPVQAARQLARRVHRERSRKQGDIERYTKRRDELLDDIANALELIWPELANPFHPASVDLFTLHGAEFVQAVESHPGYSEARELAEKIEALEDERHTLRKKWVKCQRLMRTVENVVLANNLAANVRPRYTRLLAVENQGLVGGGN